MERPFATTVEAQALKVTDQASWASARWYELGGALPTAESMRANAANRDEGLDGLMRVLWVVGADRYELGQPDTEQRASAAAQAYLAAMPSPLDTPADEFLAAADELVQQAQRNEHHNHWTYIQEDPGSSDRAYREMLTSCARVHLGKSHASWALFYGLDDHAQP